MTVESEVLKELNSPLLTSALYQRLESRGVSRGSARVAVRRLLARGALHTTPLAFRKNSQLVSSSRLGEDSRALKYLADNDFFDRRGAKDLFDTVRLSQPVVDTDFAAKLMGDPVGREASASFQSAEEGLRLLEDIGAVSKQSLPAGESVWVLEKARLIDAHIGSTDTTANINVWRTRERVRRALAETLATYAYENGLCSKNGMVYVSDDHRFASLGGLPFDVLGFSFTRGIARWREGKYVAAPLVADVLLERCQVAYARSFVARLDSGRAATFRNPEPIGALLAKSFDEASFALLRERGVMVWRHNQLLGKSTAEGIARLLTATDNLVRQQDLDPGLWRQALEGAANFGSLFGNLKGQLFELMIAHLFAVRGFSIRLAVRLSGAGGDFDVDIMATRASEVFIIECKGHAAAKAVESDEVSKHIQRRGPAAREIVRKNPLIRNPRFTFLVVTSGLVSTEDRDAAKWLTADDTSTAFWDRDTLTAELKREEQHELLDLILRYFP